MTEAPRHLALRLRTPPLAWRNVTHGWTRTLAAVAGMGFAVMMVLLQLGFLEAVKVTASVNYDALDFDVALVSPHFEQFYDPGTISLDRLDAARAFNTVVSASPLYAEMNIWRCPPYPPGAGDAETLAGDRLNALQRWWLGDQRPRPLQRRALLVLGVDIDRVPFRSPIREQVGAAKGELRVERRVLFNEESNIDFGGDQLDTFNGWELGLMRAEVAGRFRLRRSFGADAAVLCDGANFARFFGRPTVANDVNFGLLTVKPGTAAATAKALNASLPADVVAFTRAELYAKEQRYWVTQTSTGLIFAFGVAVTMFVATMVVYQVLSNDVRDHLPEYATLKAMGHTNGYLAGVVLTQAVIYAVASFVPAALASVAVYRSTEDLANIPMNLTAANLSFTLALTVVSCIASGLLTVRRVRTADPAEVF